MPSQDVFTIVLPLSIPDLNSTPALTSLDLISVCPSSWKHPNVREFDDAPTSTRILLSLRVDYGHREMYLVSYQLQFCPTSVFSTNAIDGGNVHILTCQRQSPLYVYDRDFPERMCFTSATRTGRAFGSILVLDDERKLDRNVYTINIYDFFARAVDDPQVAVPMSSVEQPSDVYRLSDGLITNIGDDVYIKLMVEQYSGALWYFRGRTLCIHYLD